MKKISPAWALLFIAPILGELVSGHQPPLEFFNPLVFIILALPYGFGALICRELMIRWKTGRFALIFLGLAYGLYEEAIVVRSMFNPNWLELESLQGYGHSFGISWTYSEMLLQFHVLISIYASILLAELLYPERRDELWLGKKGFIASIVGLLLWLPAGIMMTDYMPPIIFIILSVLAIVGLLYLASKYRLRIDNKHASKVVQTCWFYWTGFLTIAFSFIAISFTPEWQLRPPLWMTFLFVILMNGLALYLLLKWIHQGDGWDDRHRFALLSGLLSFFFLFNFLADLESFEGRSLVSIIAIWLLIKLKNKICQRIDLA
ncbi:MAG: hypothetical protein JEZ00_12160 [Anaerolineaceae bacterium]|nr:hypothetical protein [Anaerolineaceae bacterium]